MHAENLESCPGDGEDFLFEPIFNLFNFVLTDSSKDVNTTTGSSYTNSNETTKNPDDSKYIIQGVSVQNDKFKIMTTVGLSYIRKHSW